MLKLVKINTSYDLHALAKVENNSFALLNCYTILNFLATFEQPYMDKAISFLRWNFEIEISSKNSKQ